MPRIRPSAARATLAHAGVAAALRLVDRLASAVDAEAFERAVLALAAHADAGGFQAATWLGWDERRGRLVGRRRADAAPAGSALDDALDLARRPGPREARAASALDCLEIAPAPLDGALGDAWRSGTGWGAGAEGTPWAGSKAIGAVLLECEGMPRALLVGEWAGAAPPADAPLRLAALAAAANAALERRQRALEQKRLTRRLVAQARLARAAVTPLNLAELLSAAVESVAQACEARGCALWIRRGDELRLEATHGPAGERDRVGRALAALARHVGAEGTPIAIASGADDARIPAEVAATLGVVVVAPITAYEATLGVLAIWRDPEPGEAIPASGETGRLGALADAIAVGLDQARRFDEIRGHRQREREDGMRLARAERLARLGEVARRAALEARNPLASIGAFARRMQRSLAGDDAQREYLEIIVREAERLERLLEEQVQSLDPETPRLALESLNQVAQEALQQCAEPLVRRRIRLLKRLTPELPALLLDATRVRRVVVNVLEAALDATPVGGRLRVETRHTPPHALIEIAHDGPREPGDVLDQLFVPFASVKSGGPAVGLAVARQVVREHGGEVRVRSEGDWSVVVSLTFPVRENKDRRGAGPDRRLAGGDRRAAVSTAGA